MKITSIWLLFFGLMFALSPSTQAQSTNVEATFSQYLADFQAAPTNFVLRQKIIGLAQDMNPPPEIPAEAKRHMARGIAAMEDAKTVGDFNDAATEFEKAVDIAPWLANGYRDLAIANDKAGNYDWALADLKWYFQTRPAQADVDGANDLKAKIEYRKEKAAKEAAQKQAEEAKAKAEADADAARAAELAKEQERKRTDFEGEWRDVGGAFVLAIHKKANGSYYGSWAGNAMENIEANGNEMTFDCSTYLAIRGGMTRRDHIQLTINDDGRSLRFRWLNPNMAAAPPDDYYRQ